MTLAVTLLPLYNQPSVQYSVNLGTSACTLLFNYNTRTGYYHLTVTLSDGNVVMNGRKVVGGMVGGMGGMVGGMVGGRGMTIPSMAI